MSARLLILTEAGDNIGFGHFSRCTAVATEWAKIGDARMFLHLNGSQRQFVPPGEAFDWLANINAVCHRSNDFDVVLVDSYLAPATAYEHLRNSFGFVAAIDDYQRIVYPVDLVVNPNLHGDQLDTNQQTAEYIGGKRYILLREPFKSQAATSLRTNSSFNSIAITVGGSDYRSLLHPLTALFIRQGFNVRVITGHADLKERFEMAFPAHLVQAFGRLNADEMYAVFDNSDAVVTAAGQTLHELASMGKPTVAVCIDHDQKNNIDFYTRAGFVPERLYWNQANLKSRLLNALSAYKSSTTRAVAGLAGKAVVDGNGVDRVVGLLLQAKRSEVK